MNEKPTSQGATSACNNQPSGFTWHEINNMVALFGRISALEREVVNLKQLVTDQHMHGTFTAPDKLFEVAALKERIESLERYKSERGKELIIKELKKRIGWVRTLIEKNSDTPSKELDATWIMNRIIANLDYEDSVKALE